MQQIKLISKFGLALIAITAISVVMATHAYYIQAADAQPKLPNNSVRSENIVDGQVKTQDLADNSVTSEKIVDGEVQSVDIGDATITAQDIAEGTITGGNIKGETIQEADIAAGAVTGDKISGINKIIFADCTASSVFIAAHAETGISCDVPGSVENGDSIIATLNSAGGLQDVVRITSAFLSGDDVGIGLINQGDQAVSPQIEISIIVFHT